MSESERRGRVDHDNPPFSRLFIVCSKSHEEEDIREAFGRYGTLQDVWVVKDRDSKANKGICYIKFSTASEAHVAMEELHGQAIGNDPKSIKVLLADNKGAGRAGDRGGDTKPRSRIFILVPKTMSSEELQDEFVKFGEVESVQILKDRSTGESKGCAYVKFVKPSAAFQALETCDDKYKAVVAEPRVPKSLIRPNDQERVEYTPSTRRSYNSGEQATNVAENISYTDLTDPNAMPRLYIVCHTSVYEEQLYSLFDVIPGLETFELKTHRNSAESRGFAYAQYRTLELACYAKRKLDGLEYPPGHRLVVKYADVRPPNPLYGSEGDGGMERRDSRDSDRSSDRSRSRHDREGREGRDREPREPREPRERQMSGGWSSGRTSSHDSVPSLRSDGSCVHTTVSLPAITPLAIPGTACRAKLFCVSTPSSPDKAALVDVFSRFASLIDITLLEGTSYGYIRYGMKESADAAKMLMDNQTIAGSTVRLSFAEADSNSDNGSKRTRQDGFY